MPRKQRAQVESGVYHVMLRGNERKNIFSDEEDKQRVIDTLLKVRNDRGFKFYAYCIMDNHIHLVLEEEIEGIARIIKRIGTSYAYYYNHKHQRVGHVFQDRFKSEGIKEDKQLLEVIRYVHNNPVKAEMIRSVENYHWSSYPAYMGKIPENRENTLFLKDVESILHMFSPNHDKAIKLISDFTKERTEEKFLDFEEEKKESETDRTVQEYLNERDLRLETIKQDKDLMVQVVRELKFVKAAPGRQIAKFMGIDRNLVQRVKWLES